MSKTVPRNLPCYCFKVRRAANVLTKFYDKALEPAQLTISQFLLLENIKALEACNKSELAQYAKLDRTTIIRNVKTLRERGLITEVHGADNRNTLIQLTDLGESTVAAGMNFWEQAQGQIEATIGPDSLADFLRVLKNLELLTIG